MDQADFPGDTIGYINFAPFLIGTPVIDTYQLKLAIPGIDHTDEGAKRQVGVCRRKSFGVEALAIGGFSALGTRATPTRIAHPRLYPPYRVVLNTHHGALPSRQN